MTGRQMSRSRAWRAGLSRLVRVARRSAVPAAGALALLGVTPALASARVHWRLNGAPLTESIATKGKGTVKLTDTKVPIGVAASRLNAKTPPKGAPRKRWRGK